MRGVVLGAFGVGNQTLDHLHSEGERRGAGRDHLPLSLVGVEAQAQLLFDRLELLVLVLQRGGWKEKLCSQPGENLGKPEKG